MAVLDQCLSNRNKQCNVPKFNSCSSCRVCGEQPETIYHISSRCGSLALTTFWQRLDRAVQCIHWSICPAKRIRRTVSYQKLYVIRKLVFSVTSAFKLKLIDHTPLLKIGLKAIVFWLMLQSEPTKAYHWKHLSNSANSRTSKQKSVECSISWQQYYRLLLELCQLYEKAQTNGDQIPCNSKIYELQEVILMSNSLILHTFP